MVAPRSQAQTRALAVVAGFAGRTPGYTLRRGSDRLVFDKLPSLVRNKAGDAIGVDVMVRLFKGLVEVPIDPHRVIINPPTVPRANLTYEEGSLDAGGAFIGTGRIVSQKTAMEDVAYRRIVGVPDPAAACEEAVWDSVLGTPNAKGWGTR